MSDSTAKVNILWELKKKKYQFICLKLFEQSLSTLTWPHILDQCLENKHLKWMILFFPPKLNFFFFTNWSWVALQRSVSFSACVLSHFSRVWRSATLWTVAFQAPLVRGILHARILEWVAPPSSRGSSWPGDWARVSCIEAVSLLLSYQGHSSTSARWTTKWISHVCIHIPLCHHNTACSSLGSTVGSHWLSILNIVSTVHICQSQS